MADNITVSDANDVDRVLRTTDSASVHTPHHIVDSSALPTGAATQTTLAALEAKVTACNTGAVTVASSALPTGGATSTLQTSGNASLTTLAGTVSGSELQVDVVTSGLPTGAATAANQATGNTSLGTIAGAVSGSEMQVDVVGSLPAGTNAIGKLAANSGVDIGDVDVTSVSLPTAFNQGVLTVATSETALPSMTLKSGITLRAKSDNAADIFIGATGVSTATGTPIKATDAPKFIEIANPNVIFYISANSSDKLYYDAT